MKIRTDCTIAVMTIVTNIWDIPFQRIYRMTAQQENMKYQEIQGFTTQIQI
jgi:hypothetical protein